MVRAVIIDDELPARRKIRRFLLNEPRVEVVGEAGDGAEAIEVIRELKPDLLLLDIQMPIKNGFEVLQALPPPRPRIIFTTAYDQYALQAFEVRALDYLLKPFDEKRFREAIQRVLGTDLNQESIQRKLEELLAERKGPSPFLERLLVRCNDRLETLKISDIRWIQAEEKYVWLYLASGKHLHRESISGLERQLDPAQFRRVHRSAIVQLDHIRSLIAWTHGDYLLELQDGTRIPLGRSYRESFLTLFGR